MNLVLLLLRASWLQCPKTVERFGTREIGNRKISLRARMGAHCTVHNTHSAAHTTAMTVVVKLLVALVVTATVVRGGDIDSGGDIADDAR